MICIPFKVFITELLKEFDNLLIYDFTISHKTSRLKNYSNKNYWVDLIESGRMPAFYKHKEQLNDLNRNHSLNIKQQLLDIIKIKCQELSFGGARINDMCIGLISIPQECLTATDTV